MLELRNVTKKFNLTGQKEDTRIALNNVSLKIDSGEFVTVIGGNGSGKSTTMNVVTGVLKPDKGQILLNNIDITNWSENKRASYFGRVFQDPMMGTTDMSVLENLEIAYRRGHHHSIIKWGFKRNHKKIFIDELKRFDLGLETRLNQKVGVMSGGQRQALTLIMASLRSEPSRISIIRNYRRFCDKTYGISEESFPNYSKEAVEYFKQELKDLYKNKKLVKQIVDEKLKVNDALLKCYLKSSKKVLDNKLRELSQSGLEEQFIKTQKEALVEEHSKEIASIQADSLKEKENIKSAYKLAIEISKAVAAKVDEELSGPRSKYNATKTEAKATKKSVLENLKLEKKQTVSEYKEAKKLNQNDKQYLAEQKSIYVSSLKRIKDAKKSALVTYKETCKESKATYVSEIREFDITKQILLLDEHTAALDPKTAKKVLELTDKIVKENNLTTLMITHNMKDALTYGTRLVMFHMGHIILDVSGEEKAKLTVEDLLKKFDEADKLAGIE